MYFNTSYCVRDICKHISLTIIGQPKDKHVLYKCIANYCNACKREYCVSVNQ